jgi:transposase InsO family protein
LLNDRVLPCFEEHEIALSRVLTDRGTEYCGTERHQYDLYLAVEDIDHTRTKAKSPQTNGIWERFHKTLLNEFYRLAFRKKIYKHSKNSKVMWRHGSGGTMKNDPIRAGGVTGQLRCRRFSTASGWLKKK